jgi:hypothetical protein
MSEAPRPPFLGKIILEGVAAPDPAEPERGLNTVTWECSINSHGLGEVLALLFRSYLDQLEPVQRAQAGVNVLNAFSMACDGHEEIMELTKGKLQ